MQDDEIDLSEFFSILWNGKWSICYFLIVAILLSGSYLAITNSKYESKLVLYLDTVPPFISEDRVFIDFRKKFYQKNTFDEWKKNNGDNSLEFEDFSATVVVDGVVMSKIGGKQLAVLNIKNNEAFILVKSSQLSVLKNLFSYANYVNDLLTEEYVSRAKGEFKIIESLFTDSVSANSDVISRTLLSTSRYILSADGGANALSIQNPTSPRKIAPRSSLILALALLLGGVAGVFFVFVRAAVKKHTERLNKSQKFSSV